MSVLHFLLVYDVRHRRLVSADQYDDAQLASEAYGKAEREHVNDQAIEIVLVGADSLDTIRQTHGHYFSDGEPKVVLPELTAV